MQCYPRAFGPWATLHNFGVKFFSVDLRTSQYLYTVAVYLSHSCNISNVLIWNFSIFDWYWYDTVAEYNTDSLQTGTRYKSVGRYKMWKWQCISQLYP